MTTRPIPVVKSGNYTTDHETMQGFNEMMAIITILRENLPVSCYVTGRVAPRKSGDVRFGVVAIPYMPRYLVNEVIDGHRTLIKTEDFPDEYRVDEAVVNRVRQALRGYLKFEPIMGERRRYRGESDHGVVVTFNTHICNGKGLGVKSRSKVGYYLSCEI